MSRLVAVMAAYAVLAAFAWFTLSDVRFRAATVLVLALLGFKSWIHHRQAGDL